MEKVALYIDLPCTHISTKMAGTPSSNSPSRTSTPNPRFTARNVDDEDLLKEQTVGLVHLSDFKKKRLGIEESRDGTPAGSGATTPNGR